MLKKIYIYFILQTCKIWDNHQILWGFYWGFFFYYIVPYQNQNLFFPAKVNGSARHKK